MAKISNPIRFSTHFGVSEDVLEKLGVLNPTLNVDTKLFIDPFLIQHSKHAEIAKGGRATYRKHFETIIKLLAGSKRLNDTPWRNARRLMEFPEVPWTCLGHGNSVEGSGSGPFTRDGIMQTAREIVELGVDDPDLFVAMGVFEKGIGPDRISDMATNVIMRDLLKFNARVLKSLKAVPTKSLTLSLKNGNTYDAQLPINPCFTDEEFPIIFVPTDILRHLPIAKDWSDVADAASKNRMLRDQVNKQIAEIWTRKTLGQGRVAPVGNDQ